ncbi:hypothetical protein GmHk_01G000276 [Glycine max]|nr:hypothetical protein GmHk_01G000276 [Glycine max]
MCPPPKKIRTKSAPKFVKSTKCAPSMSEQVDEMNTLVVWLAKMSITKNGQKISYMNEFLDPLQQFIVKIIDSFGTQDRLVKLLYFLYVQPGLIASVDKRIITYNMDDAIISQYNVFLVPLSMLQNWTFLRLGVRHHL